MPAAYKPTPELLADLPVMNNSEIARKYGINKDTARKLRLDAGLPNPANGVLPTAEPAAEAATLEQWPELPGFDNSLWLSLEQLQDEYAKLDTMETEVTVQLKDEAPVLVVFISDLHIGHVSTQMKKLREDLTKARHTTGLYVILGGDILDNVTTAKAPRGSHHEQLTNIQYQKYLAEEFVEYLGPEKIVAMLAGNHDLWSKQSDDFDVIQYLAKRIGCPYLGEFGFVNIELGKASYRLLLAHQFRMASSFNKTHSAKRLMDFTGDADAVFVGHRHEAAGEMAKVRGQNRWFAQAGTYLKTTGYSRQLGFMQATAEMPGVVLHPQQSRPIGVFDSFSEGLWLLEAARTRCLSTQSR